MGRCHTAFNYLPPHRPAHLTDEETEAQRGAALPALHCTLSCGHRRLGPHKVSDPSSKSCLCHPCVTPGKLLHLSESVSKAVKWGCDAGIRDGKLLLQTAQNVLDVSAPPQAPRCPYRNTCHPWATPFSPVISVQHRQGQASAILGGKPLAHSHTDGEQWRAQARQQVAGRVRVRGIQPEWSASSAQAGAAGVRGRGHWEQSTPEPASLSSQLSSPGPFEGSQSFPEMSPPLPKHSSSSFGTQPGHPPSVGAPDTTCQGHAASLWSQSSGLPGYSVPLESWSCPILLESSLPTCGFGSGATIEIRPPPPCLNSSESPSAPS